MIPRMAPERKDFSTASLFGFRQYSRACTAARRLNPPPDAKFFFSQKRQSAESHLKNYFYKLSTKNRAAAQFFNNEEKKKSWKKNFRKIFFFSRIFCLAENNRQKFIDFFKIIFFRFFFIFYAYLKIYRIKNRSKLKKVSLWRIAAVFFGSRILFSGFRVNHF